MQLNITSYSTALFSTWHFIDEFGLLFDAGDGVSAGLLQKSRKIKHIFISHADRDHLTGLMQFNQLNADNQPKVYYPKDCASFPFLQDFLTRFDPLQVGTTWIPMAENERIYIKKDIFIETIKNNHVKANNGITKSLSFKVWQSKRKLKPEYTNLNGLEIKDLKEKLGENAITNEVLNNILSYSGDSPIEIDNRYENSKILIHEATFLAKGDAVEKDYKNKHSTLPEVMEMVSSCNIEHLVLGHFSIRYNKNEILKHIEKWKKYYKIEIPISVILPGEKTTFVIEI